MLCGRGIPAGMLGLLPHQRLVRSKYLIHQFTAFETELYLANDVLPSVQLRLDVTEEISRVRPDERAVVEECSVE